MDSAMTVYVDNARIPATVGHITSHLVTSSPDIEELHQFAESIGLKRSWFQEFTKVGHLYRPHYDVTDNKRAVALQAGAIAISIKELLSVLRLARES
jgi:hypothetical protein